MLWSGSSFAAAFVTGVFSWLRGTFDHLRPETLWAALLARIKTSIVPPHLDADTALDRLERRSKETNDD